MNNARPNIVLITADNQPATLLGCYGNRDVETPHIDAMASQGTRFEWAFSTNGMCSPGRASIFTGLMPSTHGIHNWLDDRFLSEWPDDWCAVREFRSLPAVLLARGYQTALIGKYHLGNPATPMPGFQQWLAFATGHTTDFYDNEVIVNGIRQRVTGEHIVDFFTQRAVVYLAEAKLNQPFFLNVNYDAPYLLPPTNLGPDTRNRYYARFVGMDFPSFPRTAISDSLLSRIDGPDDESNYYCHHIYQYLRMHNDPSSMANVCAQVAMVDDGVGRLLDTLNTLGLAENTLVIFTADQANLYGQHGLWGHTMDTDPSHLYDAGLRIPLIFWHPGHVPAGRIDSRLVSQYDLAPTLVEYVGAPDVTFANTPGRSYSSGLHGAAAENWPDAVFFEQEESRGIRTAKYSYWKRMEGLGGGVLFDLAVDPEQERDVVADPAYADVTADLDSRLVQFFQRYADPQYDLWRGGRPKGSVRKIDMFRSRYGPDWSPTTESPPEFVEDARAPGASDDGRT
jgi:arylsulfatase A-like enzyme